mmetsp:Transcript_14322/g.18803  ORF Transcript_14322/g.18803 Transcript_14322/m.18803 type:complete len:306 (+) Transcript_14322:70-987(+)
MERLKSITNLLLGAKIPLRSIEDVPPLHRRPGILKGYRPVPLSKSLCAVSTFRVHNETGNIWTHLIGFAILAALGVSQLSQVKSTSQVDFLALLVYYVGSCFCMILSSFYHMGNCHSEAARDLLLNLDVFGICMNLIASYLPGLVFGFYCKSWTSGIYVGIVCSSVLSAFTLPCLLHGSTCDQHNESCSKGKKEDKTLKAIHNTRTILLLGSVVFCIVPIIHWLLVAGPEEVAMFFPKLSLMLILYASGFFFYVTNFPESYFPGKFDIWGSSHQFWHVIVLLAGIVWAYALPELLHFKLNASCPA